MINEKELVKKIKAARLIDCADPEATVLEIIKNMPRECIIDNRQHGTWIEKCWNDPRFVDYECSVCKRSIMNGRPNYCPNCGSEMWKEGETE